MDDEYTLWCRFNIDLQEYQWSAYEQGSYGPIEKAWDDLATTSKQHLMSLNRVPPAVQARMATRISGSSLSDFNSTKNKVKEKRWLETVTEYRSRNQLNCLSPIHSDTDKKVYWNLKDSKFDLFTWKGFKLEDGWKQEQVWPCPKDIPLPVHDINARHFFAHVGRKQKKRIFYKGFDGNLIPQKRFNEMMECGCEECGRVPQWGNQVMFLSQTKYLCEFCFMSVSVKTKYRELFKKAG